jgi:trehalose 6-phosphate synthase
VSAYNDEVPRGLRFVLVLIAGLAGLTWAGYIVVNRTTRNWFENDVALRAKLAISGTERALIVHWRRQEWAQLAELLDELTRDERIMSAAACGPELHLLASAKDYPTQFSCKVLGPQVRPYAAAPAKEWREWKTMPRLPGGLVHIFAEPVIDGEVPLGFLAVVHDVSYMEGREDAARRFLLGGFAILALAASVVTVIAARLSWRGWSRELKRLLEGGQERAEFHPLMRDVRDLVARLGSEKELEVNGGAWTPHRLKQTLSRHMKGERVIIVANREPYIHERAPDGGIRIFHPASGLVTALEPVMRACSGVWVAHGSGSADPAVSDKHGRIAVPPGEGSYSLRRVWLSQQEENGYYYGFSNEGLWPLCHIAHTRPQFRVEDWRHYQAVNRKFAEAVCSEVDSEDPIILVQDYHFALLPQLIRERLPRATIISFWHIPWPNSERFGICPWRDELMEGMLGSSIVGFHTQLHCNNFIDSVDRYMEARIDKEQSAVVHGRRSTLVRPYPISVEWPSRWGREVPSAPECRRLLFAELGLPADAQIGVGVDRLDYTKGIEERFLAVERMLERFPRFRGKFTFIQLAAPSRSVIERYRQLNENVEQLAHRINERFGEGTYRPILLMRAHHEPPTIFRFYRAADFCYVSSLHDGMNLVSKEFVSAREDEGGVLVLSHFTGAARELSEALIVNPYDMEQASSALATALHMPIEEQRERMRAMRTLVSEFNVYRWAGRMLVDAARLRGHERISGRLTERLLGMEGAA